MGYRFIIEISALFGYSEHNFLVEQNEAGARQNTFPDISSDPPRHRCIRAIRAIWALRIINRRLVEWVIRVIGGCLFGGKISLILIL